ncbi:MAG: B12-binding domain-containing protein [Roseobacter sp.]
MSTDDQTDPRGVQRNRPDHVDALASTVISVLRGRQAVSFEGLRQFIIDHLERAVLAKGGYDVGELFDELRGYRLTPDAIIDQYVPAIARLLGDRWVEDKINFAEVTIGVMRLQSLLEEASATLRTDMHIGQDVLHALVIVPQGEQHFLGASVVAGQMRRLGCDVAMSFDEDFGSLSARLMQATPDLILISCSRRETLDSVVQTMQVIRQSSAHYRTVALGGAIGLSQDDIIERTGVDIVTCVADEAIAFCRARYNQTKSA